MSSALCLVMPGTRPAVERKPPPGPGGGTSDPRAQTARGSRWPAAWEFSSAGRGAEGFGRAPPRANVLDAARVSSARFRNPRTPPGARGRRARRVPPRGRGGMARRAQESLASAQSTGAGSATGRAARATSPLTPSGSANAARGPPRCWGRTRSRAFDERANPNPNPNSATRRSVRDLRAFASAAAGSAAGSASSAGPGRPDRRAEAARPRLGPRRAGARARGLARPRGVDARVSTRGAGGGGVAGGDPREPTAADGLPLAAEALAAERDAEARFILAETTKHPNADPGSSNGSAAVVRRSSRRRCVRGGAGAQPEPRPASVRAGVGADASRRGERGGPRSRRWTARTSRWYPSRTSRSRSCAAGRGRTSPPRTRNAPPSFAPTRRAVVADATVRSAYEKMGRSLRALEFCAFRVAERARWLRRRGRWSTPTRRSAVRAAPLERPGDDETFPPARSGRRCARAPRRRSRGFWARVSPARAGRCSFARGPRTFAATRTSP